MKNSVFLLRDWALMCFLRAPSSHCLLITAREVFYKRSPSSLQMRFLPSSTAEKWTCVTRHELHKREELWEMGGASWAVPCGLRLCTHNHLPLCPKLKKITVISCAGNISHVGMFLRYENLFLRDENKLWNEPVHKKVLNALVLSCHFLQQDRKAEAAQGGRTPKGSAGILKTSP